MSWTWSHSASKTLEQCPRRFALTREQPFGERRYGSVKAVTGIAVHDAIEWFISQIQANRKPTISEVEAVTRRRLDELLQSGSLLEERHGQHVDPALLAVIRRRGPAIVARFMQVVWPRVRLLRYHSHEIASTFQVEGGTVVVRIDYAGWDAASNFVVVDWKTGLDAYSSSTREQLAAYALWANHELHLGPERLSAWIANLRTGEIVEHDVSAEALDTALARIRMDRAAVREYERDGFPAWPSLDMCSSCRALDRCPEGLDALGLSASGSEIE